MEINKTDTAVVFIDPQNEVLSEKGLAWPFVGESVTENKSVENMERIFKAAKENGFEVFISPHYFFPTDRGWKFNGPLETDEVESRMFARSGRGIIEIPSIHSVDDTVEKLKAILHAKGISLFALVDHSGEAERAGMKMRPTKLLIFGNPKGGTPLMLAAPSSAIDLPLKILISEDAQGKVWLSYNSPAYLQKRHGIPLEVMHNISVIEPLARMAAE